MATYARITPATLANLAAVVDDPQDTEAANKLAQVDLQTRRFIYDYLATKFDEATEKLLAAVLDIPDSTVNGSTSNSGTEQQVVQGTISTPDLRDSSVSTAKIADDAVTTAKILDANVTLAKLPVGSAEGQLLISGATPYTFAIKSVSGDITIDKDGVVTVSPSVNGTPDEVGVEERAAAGTHGGSAGATTWNDRGSAVAWVKAYDTAGSSFLTISTTKLLLSAGEYVIEADAPAGLVDGHQLKVTRYSTGDFVQETVYGSVELASAAGTSQTRSFVRCLMTFASGDYIKLAHYTQTAYADKGLGTALNVGTSEVYARVRIIKRS